MEFYRKLELRNPVRNAAEAKLNNENKPKQQQTKCGAFKAINTIQ